MQLKIFPLLIMLILIVLINKISTTPLDNQSETNSSRTENIEKGDINGREGKLRRDFAERKREKERKYVPCEEEIQGHWSTPDQLPEYDIYELLVKSGGPPGAVNKTWRKLDMRTIPGQHLYYYYGNTDWKTWVRTEQATRYSVGTKNEELSVHGKYYWKPDNFCGWFRRSYYSLSSSGFKTKIDYGTKCTLQVNQNDIANLHSELSCIPECPRRGCFINPTGPQQLSALLSLQ